MNRFNLTSLGIILFFVLFFTACKKGTKNADIPLEFKTIVQSESYKLNNNPESPSCNLQISFTYPLADTHIKESKNVQKFFIAKFFGEDYAEMTPEEAVDKYIKNYISEFKRFQNEISEKDTIRSDEEIDPTETSFHAHLKNTVVFNKSGLISFFVEMDNYEGGAHGSHTIFAYVLDVHTGSPLQEDQLFGPNYKVNLASIIVRKIAKMNNLDNPQDLESIGYGSIEDIVPNGNFTIDENGFTYYFNENEIAAYIIGRTKVFIPYDELNIFMTEDNPVYKML